MAAFLRWAILGTLGVCVLPAISNAQSGHAFGQRLRLFNSQPSPQEISNHLNGYYAGNHKHGGYGYGGGAGYGYAGGAGGSYGGFFFPGYGNTYGLYPYGSGYNYSGPNFAPLPVVTPRLVAPPVQTIDRATGLPILSGEPQALPIAAPSALPLLD